MCAGAGCHEAPPVPPASSLLVVEEEVVDSEVEGLPVYKDTVEYKCAAGGHNLRLDWRAGQDDPSSFHVKCEEKGGDRVWEEVTWPTCAPSNHPPPGLHPQTSPALTPPPSPSPPGSPSSGLRPPSQATRHS